MDAVMKLGLGMYLRMAWVLFERAYVNYLRNLDISCNVHVGKT